MTKTLRDIKPGDFVFVVHQRRAGDKEYRTDTMEVSNVGRQYAYIGSGYGEKKFCRNTGHSVHARDCNARSNGYGFDVYLCREDWVERITNSAEVARLKDRLMSSYGAMFAKLSPVAVKAIHEILDSEEQSDDSI